LEWRTCAGLSNVAGVRLLVWNMGVGGPGGSIAGHERAWQYLREQNFDVALLQETRRPPAWVKNDGGSFIWKPKYASAWGCAVVARSVDLLCYEPDETFPWLGELSGSTAIAQAPADPKWLVSVHLHASAIPAAVLAHHSIEGVELTTPNRSVWPTNVIPHELHRLFRTDAFIWGGDLNTDPGWTT